MKRLLLPAMCAAVLVGCGGSQAQNPAPAPPLPAAANPIAAAAPGTATSPVTDEATPKVGEAIAISTTPAVVSKIKSPSDLPGPVQEVVRLSQTTLGESVLLSYIDNINESYKLSADQIIYLSDLGLSGSVVNALITREGALRTSTPAAGVVVATTPAPAPTVKTDGTAAPAPAAPTNLTGPGGYAYADVPGGTVPPPPVVYGEPPVGPMEAQPPAAAPGGTIINYNTFYESLSPYGSWVQEADYGYCWRPTVAVVDSGWHPYMHNGSWAWSDYGWYWNSSYSWGWAAFHYGRWHRSPRAGWLWQPGTDWGPAWVNWSYTGDHCAWAPLPPECRWTAGVGFSWRSGLTSVGVGFGLGSDSWVGVGWSDFSRPRIADHRLPRGRVTEIVSQGKTTVVGDRNQVVNINGHNNTVIINNGAPFERARNASRDEIRKVAIADVTQPGAAVGRPAGTANRPVIAAYRPVLASAAVQPKAPAPTVLSRQREEERKTAATPSLVASRPKPGSLPLQTAGGRNEAPSRNAPGIAAPASTARPTPGTSSTGFSAPTRSTPAPVTATPGSRNAEAAARPQIGTTPRPGGAFANPNAVTPPATTRRSLPGAGEAPSRSHGSVGTPTTTPATVNRPGVAAPSARSTPSRATEVSQDNNRIQNPLISPRLEERKSASRYNYGAAPGSAPRYEAAPRVDNRPGAAASAPNYAAPAPTYSAPAPRPSYNTQVPSGRPTFNAPAVRSAPNYSSPAPSYRSEPAPSRNFSAPAPTYSAPAPSRSAPAHSYSAPPRSSAPAPSYSAPPRSSAPAPSYSAPPRSSAPAPTYSAPAASRPSPSSSNNSDNRKNGRNN